MSTKLNNRVKLTYIYEDTLLYYNQNGYYIHLPAEIINQYNFSKNGNELEFSADDKEIILKFAGMEQKETDIDKVVHARLDKAKNMYVKKFKKEAVIK